MHCVSTPKTNMSSSIYVAGVGVISAIGNSVAEHLAAFEREDAGMGDITMLSRLNKNELPVAEVKLDNNELLTRPGSASPFVTTRKIRYGRAKEALADAAISG